MPGLAQKVAKNFHGKDKPFILDKNNYLVNGHHRYDAARLLGIEKVDAIKVDVPIELLMKKFSHTTSNTMVEDVVGMNPQAVKPFFSPQEADRANDEWVNQAQVDQDDGVIIKGTDGKQYRIMTSYGNQHFEDGEVFLQGLTDPNYIDTEGYPDAAELLYYQRSGASCNGSVTDLRKRAKNSSGEKAKMYHWCANMKSGKKKTNEDMEYLSPSAELAGEYINSDVKSGKIKNLDDLKRYIVELRLSRIIDHAEDARELWIHHLTVNPHNLPDAVNESAFENLKLPTWMSHTSLEKSFAQDFGPRYGDYVAYIDLDSDDDLAMNARGVGDLAFEMVKANDIKVMQKFLAQMPVQFTVDDLRLDNGIQVWHLVQQNKTVH